MKLNKVLFPVVLLIMAGIAMMGCSNPAGSDPKDKDKDIDWIVAAVENADGFSNQLVFTFKEAVNGLKTTDITITEGTGKADKDGTVTAKDTTNKIWVLPIETTQAGNISVKINKPGIVPGPKTVAVKFIDVEYIVKEELTFGSVYTESGNTIWDIDSDKIPLLKDAKKGSKLRLTFTSTGDLHGQGIGAIGVAGEGGDRFDLSVSSSETGTTITIDIWVSWVLFTIEDGGKLSVITWTDKNVTLAKIELIEPDEEVTPDPIQSSPPQKPAQIPMEGFDFVKEISTTAGSGKIDTAQGKGYIRGGDFTAIKTAPDNSMLRLYFLNPQNLASGWGIGAIGTNNGPTVQINSKGGASFTVDIKVSDIFAKTGESVTELYMNPWNGCIVALCELWAPQAGTIIPKYTVTLGKNQSYGHQGKLEGFLTDSEPKNGEKYTFTLSFTSDKDISTLTIMVVDNGKPGYPWNTMGNTTITNIKANEQKDATATITISQDPVTDAQHLVFETGAWTIPETQSAELKFWSLTFTKADAPPPVEPTEVLDILGAGGLAAFATMEKGDYDATTKKISTSPYDANDPSYTEFGIVINFSPAIDLSKYTHLVVTWEGATTEVVKQVGSFMPFFNTEPNKVQTQVNGIQSNVYKLTYELGEHIQNWGGSTDWSDAINCSTLEILINALDVTESWTKLTTANATDMYFTSIQLIKQGESEGLTVTLAANGEWGYQTVVPGLFEGQINENDEYEISFTFTSDVSMSVLKFFLLDQSSGWTVLSEYPEAATGITAGTPVTGSVTITATGTAADDSANANKLGFTTDADAGSEPTLTFTAFSITKK